MKPSAKIVSFKVELHHQKALVAMAMLLFASLLNFKIFQFSYSSFHSRIGII